MPEAGPMTADRRDDQILDRRVRARRRPAVLVVALLALAILPVAGCIPAGIRPTPSSDVSATSTPPPTPATPSPSPGPPTPTPGPTFAVYNVVRGDTLTSIARRFHTSPRSIAYWNRAIYPTLDPESAKYQPDNLQAGWVLHVIPGAEYSPPPGDGETGIDSTPTPPDATDAPSPGAGASAGASASPSVPAGDIPSASAGAGPSATAGG
jgi:hypothetical protein